MIPDPAPAGAPAEAGQLTFGRCLSCGTVQYFRRPFCPACGSTEVVTEPASGRGVVYAITRVHRAPSAELRAYAPYGIALVDAAEGFRFMAHAADGLAVGDPVRTGFRPFGSTRVPFVEPASS